MKAKIIIEGDEPSVYPFRDINEANLVAAVSRKSPQIFGSGGITVLAVDCGMKNNQIRCMVERGVRVKVVPWDHPLKTKLRMLLVVREKGKALGRGGATSFAERALLKLEAPFDGLFISNGPGDPERCTLLVNRLSEFLKKNTKPVFGICLGHQLLARAIGAKTYKLNVQFHPEHTGGPADCEFLFDVFIEAIHSMKKGEDCCVDERLSAAIRYDSSYQIKKQRKVLVLGSGGLTIGQAGEFDYSGAQVLGTPIQTIMNTEDRERFSKEVTSIGEQVAPSHAATSLDGAIKAAEKIGYPVLVRAAFALGGLGSGFAQNRAELVAIAQQALAHSD
ncbi:putative carbamoyl-phosphate synthase, small subunit, partial [Cooperia oncophora]